MSVLVSQSDVYNYLSILIILRKKILLNINYKDEKGNNISFLLSDFPVGLLNSIEQFRNYIESQSGYKIKHLFLGGKEINLEENVVLVL